MTISSETWAIVAATALGPIVAVGVTLWREAVRESSDAETSRRLHVFRILMATRKSVISADHVNAVNLVEVDYYGCAAVQTSWKTYLAHLNDSSKGEDQAWREKRDNLLARMLSEMGKVLKYDIPAIEIYQGGYTPGGLAFRDNQNVGAVAFLNDMADGKKALPVRLFEPSSTASQTPASTPAKSP